MKFQFLQCEMEGQTAIVTINRPPVNPLNTQVFNELLHFIEALDRNRKVRAIIITGQGDKAFVAGADIQEMANLDALSIMEMNKRSRQAFSAVENVHLCRH